jgi:farnesyl diphosphate synthase
LEYQAWAAQSRKTVEAVLSKALEKRVPAVPGRGDALLAQAMAYGLMGGGKRIRALLAVAAGEAVGAPEDWAATVGASLECIHAFSLVHDDMPCMDDDDLRRGQPTVHVKYGQAQALLVGDALQTLGFELITEMPAPAERVVALVRQLAVATGLQGMAGGQAVDIHAVGQSMTQPQLEAMHALKTGALIAAAVQMGQTCGNASGPEAQALAAYARALGLAFQVADDVLDVSADAQTLGKTPGKDAAANKPTFVALLGLNGARSYARDLHEQAVAALAPLGNQGARLKEIAHALLERTY